MRQFLREIFIVLPKHSEKGCVCGMRAGRRSTTPAPTAPASSSDAVGQLLIQGCAPQSLHPGGHPCHVWLGKVRKVFRGSCFSPSPPTPSPCGVTVPEKVAEGDCQHLLGLSPLASHQGASRRVTWTEDLCAFFLLMLPLLK